MAIKNEGANLFRNKIVADADQQQNARAATALDDLIGRPGYRPSFESFFIGTVRFKLTDVIDGGTFTGPAVVVDSTGTPTATAITVTDLLQRFQASAVSGDMGYAWVYRNTDGSTRYEITSLGNTSGDGGGASGQIVQWVWVAPDDGGGIGTIAAGVISGSGPYTITPGSFSAKVMSDSTGVTQVSGSTITVYNYRQDEYGYPAGAVVSGSAWLRVDGRYILVGPPSCLYLLSV